MRTVEIPGGTATFRESEDLRARDADLIEAAAYAAAPALSRLPQQALTPSGDEDEAAAAARFAEAVKDVNFNLDEWLLLTQMRRATIVATLDSWTLDRPLPTMATIGDLPRDLMVALDAAIGGVPVQARTDFSPDRDQESPTTASSD